MAKDEPYDLMPSREIVELRKELQELRSKRDKHSSEELLNSMDALARSMDAMLKLFTEAAKEIKVEENDAPADVSSIHEKLDKIIGQNKAIAELIEDFTGKQKKPLLHEPIPKPDFQPHPGPNPDFQRPPRFELHESRSDEPPGHYQQGPIAMPSVQFPSVKGRRKKGLFGRLRQ